MKRALNRALEIGNRFGINLNTLALILIASFIKYEAARADEGLRKLDIVFSNQTVYMPKIDNMERRVAETEGDIKILKEHDVFQDREIERSIKSLK